jgi:hypothetical protein
VSARFLFDVGLVWLFEAVTLCAAFWQIWKKRDRFWHRILMMYNYGGMSCFLFYWFHMGILLNFRVENVSFGPSVILCFLVTLMFVTVVVLKEMAEARKPSTHALLSPN